MKGFIHSYETMGTLDGPGLRTVVFLQGCPLRCRFCHNVDSTLPGKGMQESVETVIRRILRNKPYWGQPYTRHDSSISGGVTITGGDPIFQPKFLLNLVKRLRQEQVHVAVETSLFTSQEVIDSLIPHVNLWMISLKHMDNDKHQKLTSQPNEPILQNVKYLDQRLSQFKNGNKIRIRFVVIPTVTDQKSHIQQVGEYAAQLENVECFELLPYVRIGRHKWIEIFGKYELEGIREAKQKDLERAAEILKPYQLRIKY